VTLALFRHPFSRLGSARVRWAPIAAWSLLSVLVALLARSKDHGVDMALARGFGSVTLPLVAFTCFGLVCPEGTLPEAAQPLIFVGASPRRAALTLLTTVLGLSAALSALVGAVVVLVAHGPSSAPLAADLVPTIGVSALGGATYAAYFALGTALFGKNGRGVFLGLDLFGAGLGVGSLLTPRAHLRALFGGRLAAGLPPRKSSLVLLGMLALFSLLAFVRSRRR
jgi:hypothetical protein